MIPRHDRNRCPEGALAPFRDRLQALYAQPAEIRHEGAGSCETGIDEVRYLPIIRVLAPIMREIYARALGTQQNGFVGGIISGLSDTLRAGFPVEGPDGLSVTVDAAVLHIDFTPGFFLRRPRPEKLRWGPVMAGIRPIYHRQRDGGQ